MPARRDQTMLHTENETVRSLLMKGYMGLEKESLRVNAQGYMAQTDDPFQDHPYIGRDFSENQTEINTPVTGNAKEALQELCRYDRIIREKIRTREEPEYLWPFSNPAYIRNEADIPIARYYGEEAVKTRYREYLSDRYGRYKMTFSGIHFNYSFAEELLLAEFALRRESDFRAFKDQFYVGLAERMDIIGWLMVAVTAASPLLDSSFVAKGLTGETLFTGLASVRCSELGYWNHFSPILDYSSLEAYANSILSYVDQKLIAYPSELYFPIRLKPEGKYDLHRLKENGVNHIELRMIDLNPFAPGGMDLRDIQFAQLLTVWAASLPDVRFSPSDHAAAIQNMKSAAHYDLKTVRVVLPGGESMQAVDAAERMIEELGGFYRDFPDEVQSVISFQKDKFLDGENRYAWRVKREFGDDFVKKGIQHMKTL